jgi:hypothetical protein
VCEGPLDFYYGGQYLLATNAGKNDDIAKAVIETLCCDEDYMYSVSLSGNFPNSKSVVEKIIENDSSDYESVNVVSNPYPIWLSAANKLGEENVTTGDVTGDNNIDLYDLMMVLNHVSKKNSLVGTALTAADVNGDGKVDLIDLMRLLNYVSKKSKTL